MTSPLMFQLFTTIIKAGVIMVIFEDKSIAVCPEFPNSDFTGGLALYVIKDGSDIYNKIMQYKPYYDFVLDKKGNLIDIVEVEKPEPAPVFAAVTADEVALAVAELAEQQVNDKLEVDLALAELAEMITGGE